MESTTKLRPTMEFQPLSEFRVRIRVVSCRPGHFGILAESGEHSLSPSPSLSGSFSIDRLDESRFVADSLTEAFNLNSPIVSEASQTAVVLDFFRNQAVSDAITVSSPTQIQDDSIHSFSVSSLANSDSSGAVPMEYGLLSSVFSSTARFVEKKRSMKKLQSARLLKKGRDIFHT